MHMLVAGRWQAGWPSGNKAPLIRTAFQRNGLLVISLFILVYCSIPGVSQRVDPTKLAVLQEKTEDLTAQERNLVDTAVTQWLEELSAEIVRPVTKSYSAGQKRTRLRQLRDMVVKAAEGTDTYRGVYLRSMSQQIVRRAGEGDARVLINEMIIAADLADPALIDVYMQGLASADRAANLLALGGLQKARARLGPQGGQSVVAKVVQLAQSNADDVLLEWIYRFLDYPADQTYRRGLAELLRWRSAGYVDGNPRPVASDTVLVRACGNAYGQTSQAEQREIVSSLAGILRWSAEADMGEKISPVTERRRILLERIVYAAEVALGHIANASNNYPLTRALGARNTDGARAALVGWVGDQTTPGLLNGPPYNLQPLLKSRD